MNATAINEALEVLEISNVDYEAKLREIDLEWLRDTLVEPASRDRVYWPTAEGHLVECRGTDYFRGEDALPGHASTSRNKRRRTGRASSSKAAVDSNEAPLSGAQVKEDMVAVRKRLGSAFADFTLVPPNTALEVEMFLRQKVPRVEKGDFQHFTFMDEAVNGLVPSEDLDSDVDTSDSP
uniref:Uncharacterized protein n=1 Tax=Solanum tuberosum TaxID=4113 RepID=M1DUM8_SOLTU